MGNVLAANDIFDSNVHTAKDIFDSNVHAANDIFASIIYAASHILASDIYGAYLCGSSSSSGTSTSASTSTSTSSSTGSTTSAGACKNSATKDGMLLRSNGGMLLRQYHASQSFLGDLTECLRSHIFPWLGEGCGCIPSPTNFRRLSERPVSSIREPLAKYATAFFVFLPGSAWLLCVLVGR